VNTQNLQKKLKSQEITLLTLLSTAAVTVTPKKQSNRITDVMFGQNGSRTIKITNKTVNNIELP